MQLRATVAIATAVGFALGLAAARTGPASLLPSAGGHGAWYASRAAGLCAYLFLWAGLAGGLVMSSGWLDGIINRSRLLALHQSLAVTGLALALGHALVLIPDGWSDFGLVDLFVPFASSYRPQETALGTLSLYLFAIVSFTFWFRGAIGPSTWRWVHRSSFVAYLAALWHGVLLGSDSGALPVFLLYTLTASALLGAMALRLLYVRPRRTPPARVPSSVLATGQAQ